MLEYLYRTLVPTNEQIMTDVLYSIKNYNVYYIAVSFDFLSRKQTVKFLFLNRIFAQLSCKFVKQNIPNFNYVMGQ